MKCRSRFAALALVLTLGVSAPLLTGCAARASISTNPSAPDQVALRDKAGRAADGFATVNELVKAAGVFYDTLPNVSNAQKTEVNNAIIAIYGTTAAPGPAVKLLITLRAVTTEASLKTTVSELLDLVDPFVQRLEKSNQTGLMLLGSTARTAVLFARTFYVAPAAR